MEQKILTINDTIHGLIELSSMENDIISHGLFNRLHDVYQNSTVYLTFPTNRTKRFEHSIGTMHLVGEMLFRALYNTSIQDVDVYKKFLDLSKQCINKVISEIKNRRIDKIEDKVSEFAGVFAFNIVDLYNKANDLQDGHIRKRILSLKRYEKDDELSIYLSIIYQSVRIAALLHDVGHPPFSHITEKALGKVYEANKESPENLFVINYQKAKNENGGQLHENIGSKISDAILDSVVAKATAERTQETYTTWYRCIIWCCVKSILADGSFINKDKVTIFKKEEKDFWSTLHGLIDGEMDCDRLDYVVRDGLASGISGPQVEYERIISGMRLFFDNKGFVFAFLAKSMKSLETFFLKRYDLYENIISHHRVVKTDCLFANVIEKLSNSYLVSHKQESITGEIILPNDISGLWKALSYIDAIGTDNYNSLIQWDDSWLITVLKNERYKKHFHEEDPLYQKQSDELLSQLDEVLTNKKNYFSAVKRGYDFELIDHGFYNVIKEKLSAYRVKGCKSEHVKNFISLIRRERKLAGFIESSSKVFSLHYFYKFVFPLIFEDGSEKAFENIVTTCAISAMNEFNENHHNIIENIFVGCRKSKGRIIKSVKLYRPYGRIKTDGEDSALLEFTDESNINDVIELLILSSPLFYVYIKKAKEVKKHIEANEYLEILGTRIGEVFGEKLIHYLDKKEG